MRRHCRCQHKHTGIPPDKHTVAQSGAVAQRLFVYFVFIYFIPLPKMTHPGLCERARLRKIHLLGSVPHLLPALYRKSQWADLHSRAVIDEDPQSHGSRGKDQFVYSALSPGSLWHFDLCHADVRHRFLIWSLARLTQAALLLSIQCILMKRRAAGGGGWLQI